MSLTVWCGVAFAMNKKWKNRIYKLGNVDDRIPVLQLDPGVKSKKNPIYESKKMVLKPGSRLDWKNSRNILGWPKTKLRSTGVYTTHSELTREKWKTEFLQKTRILDMKIQVQLRKHKCKCYQRKQRLEENCTGRYSRGLRNKTGEHLVNVWESNILETQVN